ncbi:MAG: glycoside hydrolase family 97 protein [Clostridium sp.]|nr:glycoside hydrolase family 97 protein [Bacteroides sp.]MCM1197566.1 glycoside hydrolase family 97 protein [Clostridium sp.]
MIKKLLVSVSLCVVAAAASAREYTVASPDGKLLLTVDVAQQMTYSVRMDGRMMIYPSVISMDTDHGVFGPGARVRRSRVRHIDETFASPLYKRSHEHDCCNELLLECGNYDVVFRAYDDGAAYRFVSCISEPLIVNSETADFDFGSDLDAYIPYVRKTGDFNAQFFNTFENTYCHENLSDWQDGRLAFLPLMVRAAGGYNICIAESDLCSYPGMYLFNENAGTCLSGVFAPYPKVERQGSHNPDITVGGHNKVVVEREPYIASCGPKAEFPWRVIAVSRDDLQMLSNDLVYKLASPSRIEDPSWIKPGYVAWEWWNDRNVIGVDFEAGVNNETYKYYIDFAADNGIPYVVLDDGWYDAMAGSAFAVVPEIDLVELVSYAEAKNVGLMLWIGYYVFEKEMEKIMAHYAAMGIKGFKLDAIGRDDQKINEFYYAAAQLAARCKVVLDFHGGAKPAGLNRTYPNVLNFEGVHGLEQLKNKNYECDLVDYDLTFPFIRGISGPVDYTQGAMKNGTRASYRSIWSEPMSQGTRCRQLAEYIVFDSPLNMLCDSPCNYMKEQECTDFITSIPTVWSGTLPLEGRIGEYITVARQDDKGNWYVGSLADWNGRDCTLDLKFLGQGEYHAVIFCDGMNASRNANDYKCIEKDVMPSSSLHLHMAPGGGFAVKFIKK